MANLPTDMELELAESQRNSSRTSSPLPQLTPCEQLKYNKAQLAKMETFRRCKPACVDALMMMPDHHPDEPFYVRAATELQDIEEAMALAALTLTTSKTQVQSKTETTPNGSNNSASQNAPQNQLPPPIMLFVEENYKAQMAAITKAFSKIRSRLTGEFLKLYTDSAEERRMAVQHLKMLDFQFYTIKSKAERPIKVVIKGLPRNTNPEEIKQDLEILGYTPDRVNQLFGRKNKRPLPIFLITPRNLDNLKIFDLKTLNYLSIRVEGYDEAPPNPRAVSRDWNAFKINLNKNLSLFDFHPNNINNNNDLEQKITEFTEAVIDTHSHASRPIETDRRNFTPHNINQLIKIKNYFRKRYHQTLNPIFKSHYNRAQSDLKKELKKYNDIIWQKRLEALNTADNSLWRMQKFFKNKRPKIPPLNCATGTAVTDQQKANLLATNIKNNFVENDREDDSYNQNDELINTTINNFLSTP
ncbi:RNA-directed DNA polymerase from mobile element jockey [Trichonephila clavipes]|nr:RNA-directed DNA polymerase from mobile element jockey [Trichonephila clavipes]